VLHDDDLAQAIVDRVLERGRLLKLDGPSLRTKHLGLDAPGSAEAESSQVVRISGTNSSEFPEPTPGIPRGSSRSSSWRFLSFKQPDPPIGQGGAATSNFNNDGDRADAVVATVSR
jgi:hypothetical protein